MLAKCQGIVVRIINYSETSVILKCYTDLFGMQSYLIQGVRKNKGNIRPSQLMPLNLLQLEVYHQENKNLQRIKELRCAPTLSQIHFNFVKSSIAMFMSEVIYRAIKEENQPDELLFSYLFNSIQILDEQTDILANYPICFLLQLSRFLGFYPKVNELSTEAVFNFNDGHFELPELNNPFQADYLSSKLLAELLQLNFAHQQQVQVSSSTRKNLLQLLIHYFNQHLSNFSNMQSHLVLAEVLE